MTTTVTIDKAGRLVIPKMLRDELHLEPGDVLELECDGSRMVFRPPRSGSALQKKHGVWVFHGSRALTIAATNKVLHDTREERDSLRTRR
ncbi:MAG: AbrB/MazE/SpoVT family DNA-binding domain-containing protein [Acidobacteriaceae bacterium]|nr:AbrB/MazE/SpoVT family DNA-binding domain-containing protein [Acidobacteriaceae bacterium]MBV9781384.1 AbrB/MazE/SpoVT family DNA-binding domain-containing protein [Acidobacteriaceae bacterium]